MLEGMQELEALGEVVSRFFAPVLLLTALWWSGPVRAAPIEGVWKTESGASAALYACGRVFCIRLIDSPFAGTVIADDLSPGSGGYAGSLKDPVSGRVYRGLASLDGADRLTLRGCAYTIFCGTQHWTRLK
ncbi:DUF2147 domain-containing protein [Oryzibacter oryziterrae]|uniref:DUF2147 domain-containing protein n=1 Tax=Oryzibacter oryziterrae TaxID=2766474 RepID=UPI001F2E557A|nr:DUF2147 domain-containing protein [Oryzibacter oryziterrae]